ncbi:MAG: hypothetical protein UZ14_CFX002002927 [Chloroflexi bacterium OLB14]|nr:MAG: hypothetical protein UZ14_CFX002002927 [Chloroflexi bacterium OLB14]
MDNRIEQDSIIEDALKTYSLAEMPRNITVDVLSRIQKDKRPNFITWNDAVLSFVIALCIGALFFTVQSLPPILLAKIKIQTILLYQEFLVNARWLIPTLFFGIASLLFALTIPSLMKMMVDRRR